MLLELSIENFITIKKLDLSFEEGLTVFTGETGAGKSMLLHAMQTLLGRRLSQELIGPHQDHVRVAGLFSYEELGPELRSVVGDAPEQGEILLVREVTKSGRSRAFVNGHLVTISQLTEVGARLINICGQHQSVRILDQSNYLSFVDQFAGVDRELAEFSKLYSETTAARERVAAMREAASKAALRQAELQHLIADLSKVCEGELDRTAIEEQLRTQRGAEELEERREEILEFLESEKGIYKSIRGVHNSLLQAAKFDPQLSSLLQSWDDSAARFEEDAGQFVVQLNKRISGSALDERELEKLRATLSLIASLERKYRRDHAGLKEVYLKAKSELEGLNSIDDDLPRAEKELKVLEAKLISVAETLSKKRVAAGKRMQELVQSELRELSINEAVFVLEFEKVNCGPRGIDKVDFLISTNKGMTPRPLASVASGGELSRITLALKKILSDRSGVNVLVFDEVDTGISGRVARVVGEKLRQLSQHGAQVVCVTHLPQIASLADHHYEVRKAVGSNGTTQTSVHKLQDDEKVNEIAKMLAGLEVTKATLASAEELLSSKAI
jgi:DNA repair protein RecN (Recombination protein N)